MLAALLLCALPLDDLPTLRDAFRAAETPEARIELLDRIAALHEGVDGAEVTSAIATGLEDEDGRVRARAAELLAEDVDPEVAAAALARATRKLAAEEVELAELLEDMPGTGISRTREGRRVVDAEQLEATLEFINTLLPRLEGYERYQSALVAATAGYRDDRCALALAHYFEEGSPRFWKDEVLDALLAYGTRPAVASALTVIERHEDALDQREKRRRKLARRRPGREPDY